MNKDSVFFSFHCKQPNDSRKNYFHSNKDDSNNLINYMVDPHSYDDIANIDHNFLNIHDTEIYDQKQGNVKFDLLKKPHKKSMIFTGLVSFDDITSSKTIFKVYWQDISNLIFQTLIQEMDWNYTDWEMQSNMHFNTNNKHIQFRIYQNEKTDKNELFKKYWIPKPVLKTIKDKIFDFVEAKEKDSVLHFTHQVKGETLYENNIRIRENKKIIDDFVNLINLKEIQTKESKDKIKKVADLYYERQWFEKWLKINLFELKLTKTEQETIRNIIKNNIISELFSYVKENKKLKVFDFISKKDPNEKQPKQKFKNFDKLSQQVDFETIATYQPTTIHNAYKEPLSRWIDLVFSRQQFNIPEIEQAVNNYISSIRPNIKFKTQLIEPIHKSIVPSEIFNVINLLKANNDELEIDNFQPLINEYYNKTNFNKWIEKNYKKYNLSLKDQQNIMDIFKQNILEEMHFLAFDTKDEIYTQQQQKDLYSLTTTDYYKKYKKQTNELLNQINDAICFERGEVSELIDEYLQKTHPEYNSYPDLDDVELIKKTKRIG